jgi:hypothetical protein
LAFRLCRRPGGTSGAQAPTGNDHEQIEPENVAPHPEPVHMARRAHPVWVWTEPVQPSIRAAIATIYAAFFLLAAPVWCGAVNRDGTSCRNNSAGLLIGCHLRQHRWQKLNSMARLGRARQMIESRISRSAYRGRDCGRGSCRRVSSCSLDTGRSGRLSRPVRRTAQRCSARRGSCECAVRPSRLVRPEIFGETAAADRAWRLHVRASPMWDRPGPTASMASITDPGLPGLSPTSSSDRRAWPRPSPCRS